MTRAVRILNHPYLAGDTSTDLTRVPDPKPDQIYMLYVHVPFCRQLCTYCSFNRFYFKEDRTRSYFKTLRQEMDMVADLGYRFGAMYIGGGTPTVLLDELAETIDKAKGLFPDIKDVSSETNPIDLGDELYQALSGRVDRLSVGVQSFDNDLLRQMSRYQTTGSAEETLERVRSMRGKFGSFNVDMIYNFPTESFETLAHDLELVRQTGCNQTTFYPLMASPEKRRALRRTIGKIDYKREHAMFNMVYDGLTEGGLFVPSSAWTFSANRDMIIDEYIVDYPEYVGIGSGAMSYLGGANYTNTFSLREYHKRIDEGKMGLAKTTGASMGKRTAMRYTFAAKLFGLYLDNREFKETYGVTVQQGLPLEMAFMKLVGALDQNDEDAVTLTAKGRYLMVALMRETLAHSNDYRDQARAALSRDEYTELLEPPK